MDDTAGTMIIGIAVPTKKARMQAQSRRSDSRGVIGRQKRPHEQSQHEQTSVGEMHTLLPSHTIVVAAQPPVAYPLLSRPAIAVQVDDSPSSTHRQKQAKATTQVTRIEVASVGKMQSSTSAMAGGISSQLNSPGHSRGESRPNLPVMSSVVGPVQKNAHANSVAVPDRSILTRRRKRVARATLAKSKRF